MTRTAWPAEPRHIGVALGVPLLLTVGLSTIGRPLSSSSAALLYQLGVVGVAMTTGLVPSMLTALLSMLAFHYFFVPAYSSFKLESGEDLVRLGVFLAVAISTSGLAGRARTEAEAARRRAAETASLYELSQLISAEVSLATILPTIAQTTRRLLGVPHCAIWLADPGGPLREQSSAGDEPAGGSLVEAPMRDGAATLGALRITVGEGHELSPHDRRLLETLAAQAALAVARARLVQQAAHTEALAQSDQLKSALIASVSHDLRTPLATIKGAASALQSSDIHLPHATQRGLAQTIEREADQLDRTIENLLDMSRLEAGATQISRNWHDLPELIGVALQRLAPALEGRAVTVQAPPEPPLVWASGVLLEHVLTNLLENVAKYTPPGSPVEIGVAVAGRPTPALVVTVRDHGPGIPADELEQVFAKFYRGPATSRTTRGSGLGLTICRGIVTAHGGTIGAANCPGGGAIFTLTLPLAGPPSQAAPAGALAHEEAHVQETGAHRRG